MYHMLTLHSLKGLLLLHVYLDGGNDRCFRGSSTVRKSVQHTALLCVLRFSTKMLTKNTPRVTEQTARATAVGWLRVW